MTRILTILQKKVIYSKFMRIGPNIVVKTHLAYKGNTANDKNHKKVIYSNDKNTYNFTEKSDLFKIYANWAQHCC